MPRPLFKDREEHDYKIGGAVGHYKGEDIVFTDDVWTVNSYNLTRKIARAAISKVAGTLMVHMVEDYDANGDPIYYAAQLYPGFTFAAAIDAVKETGSTAALFTAGNLTILF